MVPQAARPSLRAERSNPSRRNFFFQAEDGIRVLYVTGVQTCALPISGTHNHWRLWLRKVSTSAPNTNSTAYGSLRSQERHKRVRQAARPSLRAERSNPSRRQESVDCFVASAFAR